MIKRLWITRRYRLRTRFDRFAIQPNGRSGVGPTATTWGTFTRHFWAACLRLPTSMGIGNLILAEALRIDLPQPSRLPAPQLDFLGRDP